MVSLPVPEERGNARKSAQVEEWISGMVSEMSREPRNQIEDQVTHVHSRLAQRLARMDVMDPDVLRVTPAFRALENCAEAFRVGHDADLYFKSEKDTKISTFWSHSWHGGHWRKIMTLMNFYNGRAAVILGSFAAALMMFLSSFLDSMSSGFLFSHWSIHQSWFQSTKGILDNLNPG